MKLDKLVSHPDKVFWPDEGYTKLDLAHFYEAVFPKLGFFVKDRPLSLERCPDGMRGECFYQKQAPKGLPGDTPTEVIQHREKKVHYVVGGSLTTQIALVNLGCIAVHVWGSRIEHPNQPDWVVFDIDPTSGKFADAAKASLLVKAALDELNLTSFPKTSGSRGMHVFVPIRVGPSFDEARTFAEDLGTLLAAAHPDTLTVEQRLSARHGRVYLDPMRNSFGATVVAPYSVRRRAKAPFSMPLSWGEVTPDLDPERFNLGNLEKVLGGSDAWRDFSDARQSLKRAALAVHKV